MNEENFYSGIRNKDETVLDTAMAYYKPLFYKVGFDLLYPVGTYEDVSDCITDTWFYIWEHIDLFPAQTYPFKSWCLLIFKSRVLNQRAYLVKSIDKHQRWTKKDRSVDIEKVFIDKETYRELIRTLNTLPPPKKEIFDLYYMKHLKPKEISDRLNLSVKKIYYHIETGKQLLKEMLDYE